ncbi:MAG: low specificity L-threonine aldolase [Kiloniella sp.]|nr:low specificity L-threonine aldolase [Kiloniella sp.]
MIDFYSDTKTRPDRAMREAMLDAPVGDEQKGEDPTTRALEERVADLLGKEAAVFLPSGTMCNEIALKIWLRPGDALIGDRLCHVITSEGGGPAALAGAMIHPVDTADGIFSPEDVKNGVNVPSRYAPRTRLVCVEQTFNLKGGTVWPVAQLDAVSAAAKAAGLATHMDGARLMNAVVASGVEASTHAAGYDSVWIDFTKGLGAPVGAILAGSRDFIEEAWRFKQMMGGAMRQSGVLAAMCLYALDRNVERLADDHALADTIAARLTELPHVASINAPQTNLLFFTIDEQGPTEAALTASCARHGVQIGSFGPRQIRLVTHLDVGPSDVDPLIDALAVGLTAG